MADDLGPGSSLRGPDDEVSITSRNCKFYCYVGLKARVPHSNIAVKQLGQKIGHLPMLND